MAELSDNPLSSGFGGPPAPSSPSENPGPSPALALPPPPVVTPPSPSPMIQHLSGGQDQAAARFAKMKQAMGRLAATRKELDGLVALGDTVTQDDVVKAASGLVAAGLGAVPVAGLLADMPADGEPLQAWVAQHDAGVRQREFQAGQALALTRHELGLAAMRNVIGHSAEGAQQPGEQPPSSSTPSPLPSNPLEPSNAN